MENYYESLQEQLNNQLNNINTNVEFDDSKIESENRSASIKIIEESKTYIWIRLFLKEENLDIKPGDDITIEYTPSGEKLEIKFLAYDKKGLQENSDGELTDTKEDDKKILIFMVDEKLINYSNKIPFIRTLFKTSYHYQEQVYRRVELPFTNNRTNEVYDYFDVNF